MKNSTKQFNNLGSLTPSGRQESREIGTQDSFITDFSPQRTQGSTEKAIVSAACLPVGRQAEIPLRPLCSLWQNKSVSNYKLHGFVKEP